MTLLSMETQKDCTQCWVQTLPNANLLSWSYLLPYLLALMGLSSRKARHCSTAMHCTASAGIPENTGSTFLCPDLQVRPWPRMGQKHMEMFIRTQRYKPTNTYKYSCKCTQILICKYPGKMKKDQQFSC